MQQFLSDHPSDGDRRDAYAKKLYEYSNKHVTVKDGTVKVNGKDFVVSFDKATLDALLGL